MSAKNMTVTWLRDDTIRVTAEILDYDSNAIVPDSNTVVVYDPFGTVMGTLSVSTNGGSNLFKADYIIPAAGTIGEWKVSWKSMFGTYPAREAVYFMVGEG